MFREPPKAKKAIDLLNKEFPQISCWIEPEILPKGGTLCFGGTAKAGKSFIMNELVRALILQKKPFDCPHFNVPYRARVLVLEQELGERGFQKRLRRMLENENPNAWGEYLWYESRRPEIQIIGEGFRHIRHMVEEVRPNVLILDPVSMFYSCDENSSEEIGKVFKNIEGLKQIHPEDEMSVIFSHHFGKPGRGPDAPDPLDQYNFRGSSKWKDSPDTLCTVVRDGNINGLDWEAWNLRVRWLTRHESSPPDMKMTVNGVGDDGRVRWVGDMLESLPRIVAGPKKDVPKQNPEDIDKQERLVFRPV